MSVILRVKFNRKITRYHKYPVKEIYSSNFEYCFYRFKHFILFSINQKLYFNIPQDHLSMTVYAIFTVNPLDAYLIFRSRIFHCCISWFVWLELFLLINGKYCVSKIFFVFFIRALCRLIEPFSTVFLSFVSRFCCYTSVCIGHVCQTLFFCLSEVTSLCSAVVVYCCLSYLYFVPCFVY